MTITKMFIRNNREPNSVIKAFVDIIFDSCFVIRGFSIQEEDGRLRVNMPNHRAKDGNRHDTACPIKKEMFDYLFISVLSAYDGKGAIDFEVVKS